MHFILVEVISHCLSRKENTRQTQQHWQKSSSSSSDRQSPQSVMAPPFDPSNNEAPVFKKRDSRHQLKFLIPLIYAPILPLIRISLRRNPVLRDRVFYGCLTGAFAHGMYLVLYMWSALLEIPAEWHQICACALFCELIPSRCYAQTLIYAVGIYDSFISSMVVFFCLLLPIEFLYE